MGRLQHAGLEVGRERQGGPAGPQPKRVFSDTAQPTEDIVSSGSHSSPSRSQLRVGALPSSPYPYYMSPVLLDETHAVSPIPIIFCLLSSGSYLLKVEWAASLPG